MFAKLMMLVALLFGESGLLYSRDVAPPTPAATAPVPQQRVPAPRPVAPAQPEVVVERPAAGGALITPPLTLELPAVPVAASPTADQVVAKVQAFYSSTKHLYAKFRQSVTNQVFGTTTTSDGKVWIKKPGKMRWDYMGNPRGGKVTVRKSFISDGAMLWAVEHDNKQVFKKELSENLLPVAVTFLYGKGDLARDFKAALDRSGTYGGNRDVVLELTPKKPSAQYKRLYLVVDPSNYRVKQSIVVDSNDNVNHFRFYEPNTTVEPKDGWFVFNEAAHKSYRTVEPENKP